MSLQAFDGALNLTEILSQDTPTPIADATPNADYHTSKWAATSSVAVADAAEPSSWSNNYSNNSSYASVPAAAARPQDAKVASDTCKCSCMCPPGSWNMAAMPVAPVVPKQIPDCSESATVAAASSSLDYDAPAAYYDSETHSEPEMVAAPVSPSEPEEYDVMPEGDGAAAVANINAASMPAAEEPVVEVEAESEVMDEDEVEVEEIEVEEVEEEVDEEPVAEVEEETVEETSEEEPEAEAEEMAEEMSEEEAEMSEEEPEVEVEEMVEEVSEEEAEMSEEEPEMSEEEPEEEPEAEPAKEEEKAEEVEWDAAGAYSPDIDMDNYDLKPTVVVGLGR